MYTQADEDRFLDPDERAERMMQLDQIHQMQQAVGLMIEVVKIRIKREKRSLLFFRLRTYAMLVSLIVVPALLFGVFIGIHAGVGFFAGCLVPQIAWRLVREKA